MSENAECETSHQLTLFAGDFPAPTSRSRAGGRVSRRLGRVSGKSLLESFATYDPDTSSWKTSRVSFITGWEEFSEIWPRSGMMRNGKCYQRPMSELRTSGNESGLWPTPSSTPRGPHTGREVTEGGQTVSKNTGTAWEMTLETAVRHWPTPASRDYKDTPGMATVATNPDGSVRNRTDQLARRVYQAESGEKTGGSLNPEFVEWLMGFQIGFTDLRPSGTP